MKRDRTSTFSAPFIVLAMLLPGLLNGQGTQTVLVNEVMASNDQAISSGNELFPDWIELYNPGASPVALAGYYISDDPMEPLKHLLTGSAAELTVPPQGYLVLWASGLTTLGARHLGFSLSTTGEAVLLHAPDGTTLVDSMSFGPQLTDVSYGRQPDGATSWMFFSPSTPGGSNNGSTGALGFLQAPEFSIPSGFYPTTFTVDITSLDPGVTIYYSRDGSVPGPDRVGGEAFSYKNRFPQDPGSPVGPLLSDTMRAFVLTGPVVVASTAPTPNRLSAKSSTYHPNYPPPYMPTTLVRKGTVLKARAYKVGYLPSPVVTHTYFITSGGTNPYAFPVIALSTDESNLFGYNEGIYTAGEDFDNWRAANPGNAVWDGVPANWQRNTEYRLAYEFFGEQQPMREYALDAGLRLHGNWTLARPRKSLRLYFRDQYGQSTLGQPIFNSQPDIAYKRLLIRNSGNDEAHTNLRDISMQKMVRHMRFATQDMRSSVLFMNGEFWGVHHVRERLDHHYIARKYGVAREDLDLLEINSYVEEGSADHYGALIDLVSNADLTDPVVYDNVRTRMDVDDFIDLYSATIFIGNTDWPHNNVKYYRKRTASYLPEAPHPHDGRWRWMMYDTDFGFGYFGGRDASFDYLGWATSPSGNGFGSWSTLLFRRLLLNPDFRNAFINRHADMLNTAYRSEVTSGIIQDHRDQMAPDMAEHFPRWVGRPGSFGVWDFNIAVLHTYAQQRPGYARQELLDHFQLPSQHVLTVDVSHTERGYVRVNSIEILESTQGVDPDPYPWQGTYFRSVPITLTAEALPGYVFLHWTGSLNTTDATITVDMNTALSVTAVFDVGVLCPRELVHYWHFNDLPSGVLTEIPADQSTVDGALIYYAGEGLGYMDRTGTTEGTELNAQDLVESGRALRVRNPSDARELIIATPSTGYRNVILTFAAMRTNIGAEQQSVAWTVDPDQQQWTSMPPSWLVTPDFTLRTYDLAGIEEAWNNPHLAFRIRFSGNSASGTGGNNRFDNISLTGQALPEVFGVVCDGQDYSFNGITYNAPGSFLVTVGDPAGCDAVVVLNIGEFAADTSVTVVGGELFANSLADNYQWVNCNSGFSPVLGADEQFFTPWTGGSYAVIGYQGGCSWMSGCHLVIITGTDEANNGRTQVYPNPVTQVLTIQAAPGMGNAPYLLLDQTGRTVRSGTLQGERTQLAMEDLAMGLYILHIKGHLEFHLRVVKQ